MTTSPETSPETAPEIPPKIALEQRLTEVLGTRDVHPDSRRTIREAYENAESWEDLPPDVRALVEKMEQLPRQAWDDPADVPDDLNSDVEEDDDGE